MLKAGLTIVADRESKDDQSIRWRERERIAGGDKQWSLADQEREKKVIMDFRRSGNESSDREVGSAAVCVRECLLVCVSVCLSGCMSVCKQGQREWKM